MTNNEVIVATIRGIDTLKERQKMLGQEHRERAKRLIAIQKKLISIPTNSDLFTVETSIPPEDMDLVQDPLRGL